MRVFSALVFLLAAPVAAQNRFFPYPFFAVPTISGMGFGSALATSAAQAATSNPAALPGWAEAGATLRGSTTARGAEMVFTNVDGSTITEDNRLDAVRSSLPHEGGLAWVRGPFRIAAGYVRPNDGREYVPVRIPGASGTFESALTSTLQTVGVAAAYVWEAASGVRVIPGVRIGGAQVRGESSIKTTGSLGTTTYREVRKASGAVWATGVVLEGDAWPARLGVAFAPKASYAGEAATRCTPAGHSLCIGSPSERPSTGIIPARLDASLGTRRGRFSADATLSRVFWQMGQDSDDTFYRDAFEGGANVRYAAMPGLTFATGFHQTARTPFQKDDAGVRLDFFDQDPTRFLLLGATYERGPLVLDAAYVNGTLLSDDGSKIHLGSLGVGYRF